MHVVGSDRADGDLHPFRVRSDLLAERQRSLVDLPWTMLDQIHGTGVVIVDAPGAGDGRQGDVALLEVADAAVGIWAADCALVVIVAADGRVAALHAGWRGLAAGVLDVACDALGTSGSAASATAVLGPCLRACCGEFGRSDLETVAAGAGVGPGIVGSTTTWGAPSLDVPATVGAALARRGIAVHDDGGCTRCDDRWFSHRRGDVGRHVVAVWRGL